MTMNTHKKLTKFNPCKEQRFVDLLALHKVCYPNFPMETIFYAYKYADIDKDIYKEGFARYCEIDKKYYENANERRKMGFHLDAKASLQAYYRAKCFAVYDIMHDVERM